MVGRFSGKGSMKNSHIEWTDHTFNGWIGCTKVSPGCVHCYAWMLMAIRWKKVGWGKGAPRLRTSPANWKEPLKWERDARMFAQCPTCGWRGIADGTVCPTPGCLTFQSEFSLARQRVFCASLGDWLDAEVEIKWLADLLKLIHDTPNLDWLLLTKRPQNWKERIRSAAGWMATTTSAKFHDVGRGLVAWLEGEARANIWIGTSVENQACADERIPQLLDIPAAVRFLSCEPLLEELDLFKPYKGGKFILSSDRIHWVICGGESGPGAHPMHPDWARSLRDQCTVHGVPFLFKQWGEFAPVSRQSGPEPHIWVEGEGIARPGKKAAGRLLDGREWNEFPKSEVAHA
jgi:protein gp37